MHPALKIALDQNEAAERALLLAVAHADSTIRKYIWRGFRRTASQASSAVCAGDRTADDFVFDALSKLIDGTRTYDPERPLLENLNSITDSLISSHKKSSDRTPLIDSAVSQTDDGRDIDPISTAQETSGSAEAVIVSLENRVAQVEAFNTLREHFEGNEDMLVYLDAMREGFFLPREIADLTHLTAERVSELRRTARNHAKILFGVQNFVELKRKIEA